MKEYFVYVPATAVFNIRVEAESEEEAIEKALDYPFGIKVKDDPTDAVILDDFQLHRSIVEGNWFRGSQNEISVEQGEELEFDED